MRQSKSHHFIPTISSIDEFFRAYGLSKPLNSEVMCMRLEDQPDDKLLHMPIYRANFFRVIHFTNSSLEFNSGGKQHEILNNCLCFTYPGKLESWKRKGKLYGFVVYFNTSFSGLDITHQNFDVDYPFFTFNAEMVLPLTDEESSEISIHESEMIREIYSEAPDRTVMIKNLLSVYLQKIKRIYEFKVNRLSPDVRLSKSLFNRFRWELDDYMQQLSTEEKVALPTVSIMAGKLFVNANYLNSSIKELTGKTASVHIREKMLLEAKAFLIHSNLQVREIAYKLGFESASYFNRFFKKNALLTPIEYRRQFVKPS